MSPESFGALFFGVLAGAVMGWFSAWRFARKLEYHDVELWKWDQHVDLAAPREPKPRAGTVHELSKAR